MKKSESLKFLAWCVLLEVFKMSVKIMLRNGYRVMCVNWASSI
jgi:hypothetical protein